MSSEARRMSPDPKPRRLLRSLFAGTRGFAMILGAFTLLNIAAELRHPGFDANLWWIDLRFAERSIYRAAMFAVAVQLLSFAIRPDWLPLGGWVFRGTLAVLMFVAAWNALTFYQLLARQEIRSGFPIPLSGGVFLLLGLILWGAIVRKAIPEADRFDRIVGVLTAVAGTVLFPVAQMHCFGMTDYRREADIIVVFGCLVRSDGTPSMALSDRVKTAVELFHEGFADRLVFSGGPGQGAIHETEAMTRLAVDLGVPKSAIETDLEGLNTQATVHNFVKKYSLVKKYDRLLLPRVLAVSHFYHLPRIKLCFRRAGMEVRTVPCQESARLDYYERNVLREVAALWWYYLNPD